MVWARAHHLLILLALLGFAKTKAQDIIAPAISLLSSIPLSVQLGTAELGVEGLEFHIGASLYPLPVLLEGELTMDITADLTYRVEQEPLAFYIGLGPRISLLGSDWLAGRGPIGTYVGAGAVAGIEFGLGAYDTDLVTFYTEAGLDYVVHFSGETYDGVHPRISVGFKIPLIGINQSRHF